jgi:hypothetical protein
MSNNGELRLVGGLSMVREKETPKEKVVAGFFRAFSTDTDEKADGEFEARLAAAFRASDAYYRGLGWRPPEKRADPSLSLFAAAE